MTTQAEIIDLVKDGRRYREKRSKWEQFWIGVCIRLFVIAPLDGWLFMVAVGVIHAEWWPAVPTIGYWWSTLLMAFFVAIFGKAGTGKAKS